MTDQDRPRNRGATILVVEDDPLTSERFCQELKRDGYQVESASNGRQARRRTQDQGFDLLVIDLALPEEDGIETIRQVRTDHPEIAILAVSAFMGGRMLSAAKWLGADRTVLKPVASDVLRLLVKELLSDRLGPPDAQGASV